MFITERNAVFQSDISGKNNAIAELKSMNSVSNLSSVVCTHALNRERRVLERGRRD